MEDTEGQIPPISTPEDPHALTGQISQKEESTEIREPIPSEPEEQMKEFDQLRKRENEIGEELDRQLMDVLDRKTEWTSKLPWTEMVERNFVREEGDTNIYPPAEEQISYWLESTDNVGNPVQLVVSANLRGDRITVIEGDAQGKVVSKVFLCGRMYSDVDTPRHLVDMRGMVGFIDPKDKSSQKEKYNNNSWNRHFRVKEFASTAYGYDDYGGGFRNERQRYLAPGMEHLRSPLEYARDAMDKLEKGKITQRSVSKSGGWEPVVGPIQPPVRNT